MNPVWSIVASGALAVLAAGVGAQTSSQPQHKVYGFVGRGGDRLFGAPAGDVNADGYPDLIMNALNRVDVYSGRTGRLLHTWNITSSLNVAAAGDVNNDGKDDVLVYLTLNTVNVYSGADGKLLYSTIGAGGFGESAMAGLGDLNADGYDEFAAGSQGGMGTKGYVNVYSGKDGKLLYQVTGDQKKDYLGYVAAVGDINLDRVPDFAAGGVKFIRVYSGSDGKTMATVSPPGVGGWPAHAAGDLNKDGFPDLMVGAGGTEFISGRWLATGKTKPYLPIKLFTLTGWRGGPATLARWSRAAVGDLNGDGHADFCAFDILSTSARLFSGKDLKILGTVGAGTKWSHMSSADINQDGVMELILSKAWDWKRQGWVDGHCEVLSLKKLALATDTHKVSVSTGGTQKLLLDAGTANKSRNYWVFGSATGTKPGVALPSPVGSVTLPLVPDIYTDFTIALANTAPWVKTRGTLDANGKAQASIVLPKVPSAHGVVLYHAYLVYDSKGNFYMASNPTTLLGVK